MKKERSKKYRIIQALRILTQFLFFALFFYLLIETRFPGEDYIGRVEIFFHFNPLLAVATLIASRTIFLSFIFSAITILVTFVLGRVICGWVCPLGSIHQFFSFLFKESKLLRPKEKKPGPTAWKYYIFIFILVSALFTLDLVGFLDPLSLLYRSFTTSILPALSIGFNAFLGILYQAHLFVLGDSLAQFFETLELNATFIQGFFIGLIFVGLVLLNRTKERFWCRYLCPLGAFLGLISRWNILKLRIDSQKCIECDLCNIHCQTEARPFPDQEWKSSECDYCFTCSAICPTSAINFPVKRSPEKIIRVDLSRRKLIFTSIFGLLAVPFFRFSSASNPSGLLPS